MRKYQIYSGAKHRIVFQYNYSYFRENAQLFLLANGGLI